MRRRTATLLALAAAALTGDALGWEAATTHAGLTEQAARASALHARLRDQFGLDLGLLSPLTVPPADAPGLFAALARLNPTHGYVPDARGRQPAVAWLTAGAVVADLPASAARNHFFDPQRGAGLPSDAPVSGGRGWPSWIVRWVVHRALGGGRAVAAPDWIDAADNPLGLSGFVAQYRKAVTAATPAERERHLAGALVAAGALLHVLQDMGSPSHVHDDLAAHARRLSDDPLDLGSRFERIAALAFGRVGVPAPAGDVAPPRSVRDLFVDGRGGGLAEWTAARFWSDGTLPRAIRVRPGQRASALAAALAAALRAPAPAPSAAELDLLAAARPGGATWRGAGGVCLARYRIDHRRLTWWIDDDCALEQIAALLPVTASYSAAALDFLFRGALSLAPGRGRAVVVTNAGAALGAGTLTVLWDDARGVRTPLRAPIDVTKAAAGERLALVDELPAGARAVAVLFDGVDANGQPVVAAGWIDLARR